VADYGYVADHAAAVLALLRDSPDLTVYPAAGGGIETVPTGAAPPYVAVHFTAARPLGGRLDHRSTRIVVRIYAHCVGATDIAARHVSDLVANVLLDIRPVIDGRTCYPIRHESSREPRDDESTGTLVATLTEVYRLESTPGVDGS
jgi:hypothetical protein